MDEVRFYKDQFCNITLVHKAGKKYDCVSEDEESYYIRQEGCPKGKSWVTRFPKDCLLQLFEFVD